MGVLPANRFFCKLKGDQTVINYIIRRLLLAIPTLLLISFIIFAILDLAPNDPTGNLPMTVPPEVREKIRVSLGPVSYTHLTLPTKA